MTRVRILQQRALRQERGAQAVEFALVVPLLLLLLVGIIEFGRILNVHISVSGAAREGARVMAIQNDAAAATDATIAAAPALALSPGHVAVGACSPGDPVTVTVTYPFDLPLIFLSGPPVPNVVGTGVMRCGG